MRFTRMPALALEFDVTLYHLRMMRISLPNLLDGAALGASWLCLAHCLLLPLAFALLPALSSVLAVPEWFHAAVLATALPISAAALLPRHRGHRAVMPMLLATVGLSALAAGLAAANRPLVETGLTVIGSLLLASAHVANWRARRGLRPA